MKTIWKQIRKWLRAHAPDTLRGLNRGASRRAIADSEKALGVAFPPAVRESYLLHDGQTPGSPGLFDGWEWLSLERIRDEWSVWQELADAGEFKGCRSTSKGWTARQWWHPAWIPLTSNGAGDHHCLDLAAGPKGRKGQIIQFFHDAAERIVVASGFKNWLRDFAAELKIKSVSMRTAEKTRGKEPAELPSMDEFIALIGDSISSRKVQRFLRSRVLTREDDDGDLGPPSTTLSNKQAGFEIRHSRKGRIETIFLYAHPRDGYHAFRGPLSKGLRPENGLVEVRKRLGKPTRSRPEPCGWDRFDSDRVCIHFAYVEAGEGIRLITLMAPDVAP